MKVTLIRQGRKGAETFVRIPIEEVVEMIRTGQMRDGRPMDTDVERRPSVCFSSDLRNIKGQQVAVGYNDLVLLEINNLPDRETACLLRQEAAGVPFTMLAFVGASGRSVKIVCQTEERTEWQNPDGYDSAEVEQFHLNAYAKLHYVYSMQLAVRVDNIAPSLRTACRLSHDPDIYVNTWSEPMVASPYEQSAQRLSKVVRPNDGQTDGGAGTIAGLSTMASRLHEYQACKQDALEACRLDAEEDFVPHVLETLAFNCHESGVEEGFAVKQTLFDKRLNGDPDLVQTVFDSQYSVTLKRTWPLKHVKPSQLLTFKTEAFLQSRYELRKNVMTGVAQYRERDGYDYQFHDLTREVMNTMSIRALKAGLDSWDKDIKRYIESTMIPEYDPVNDWLERLPRWDGRDRLTALAARVRTDNAYWQSDFHVWMLSMVAHWMGKDRHHGNAIVPLLIGAQGCGKSTFCGILLPPELRDYYNDKIDFKNDTAVNLGLTSFALINIDEFDALSRSQQPLLKYLISKSDVKMRPPYGKAYEQRRRYASFIATTNNSRPLPDDKTGSRRFVCIMVEGLIDTLSPVDYPQVYAQLKAEIDRGDRYWFDEADNRRIIEQNRRFEPVGSYEQMILQAFRAAEDGEEVSVGDIVDVLNALYPNFHITKRTNVDIGRALNTLGFRPRKTNTCQMYPLVRRD
ncbi:MAG: hypothetical protein IJ588_01580 [Prevotella sp.]|nr:hypothetical protein [Prevotella sp.]